MFDQTCQLKSWQSLKEEYNLDNNMYFQWMQLIHSIPAKWKHTLKIADKINDHDISIQDHHLIKNFRILTVAKLSAKEIYSILTYSSNNQPTSQKYYEKVFTNDNLDWSEIYSLPRIVTVNSYQRVFQYKILHNILYLNQKLFVFGKSETPLCSFCQLSNETISHLFFACPYVTFLWEQLNLFLGDDLELPALTLQTATFGFLNEPKHTYKIVNHLLLLFKLYIYRSRKDGNLHIIELISSIRKIKKLEKEVASFNDKKMDLFNLKWEKTNRTSLI